MKSYYADASPTKEFFLEMFTRDISLEDCILDLVDNSVDALIRTRDVDVSSIFLPVSVDEIGDRKKLPKIKISMSERRFQISDDCGGIPFDYALKEVFRFGHQDSRIKSHLGVYGVGLNRAIFKIGNKILIKSKTEKDGFEANINVEKWSKEENWEIPIIPTEPAKSASTAGTCITIDDLRPEVKMKIRSGSFLGELGRLIGQTYSLFLERYVLVIVSTTAIHSSEIPLGSSNKVKPAKEFFTESFADGDVGVTILASLARRLDGEWRAKDAGWYAMCNGRVVVFADKTYLTGWGIGIPSFHSKYRGFIGIANFYSKNPHLLPWTTTKRGLNRESQIYQKAINKMNTLARPILSFLDKMYPSEISEELYERRIADEIELEDIRKIASDESRRFEILTPKGKRGRGTVSVQYKAEKTHIEKVKKRIRKPSYSASQIGKYTFEHFLKTECPE